MIKEKERNQERKFAGLIRIFITICFWACLLSAALCTVLGVIFILFPEAYLFFVNPFEAIGNLPSAMKVKDAVGVELSDMLEYSVRLDAFTTATMKPVYEVLLFKVAVGQSLLALFFYQLLQIIKSIKLAQPFTVKNSARISIMGILLIIYTIAARIGDYFMLKLTMDRITIPELKLQFSLNTGGILIGLLLVLLAGIFRYGGYLQEEYDTTL